jgi:hypothetical protein
MQRIFIKKYSLFTVGSVCHLAVYNWVEIFSQGRLKIKDDADQARKWLRQRSKISMLRVSTHW